MTITADMQAPGSAGVAPAAQPGWWRHSFALPVPRGLVDAVLWCMAAYLMTSKLIVLVYAVAAQDLLRIGNAAIEIEEVLFHLPLFLGMSALIERHVGLRTLSLAVILAVFSHEIELFTGIIHDALAAIGFYALAYGETGLASEINIQYGIVTAYGLVFPAALAMALWRRSVARWFVVLIMTATLGTTTLFHLVIVDSALLTYLEEARADTRRAMAAAIDLPRPEDFEAQCAQAGVLCAQLPVTSGLPADWKASVAEPLARAAERLHWQVMGSGAERYSTTVIRPAGALDRDVRGQQYLYRRQGGMYRVAIDVRSYNHLPARHKIYFATLTSAAHLWWVFGGMALLAFHRRRVAYQFLKARSGL